MAPVMLCLLFAMIGTSYAAVPQYSLLGLAGNGYITVEEENPLGTELFFIYAQDSDPDDNLTLSISDSGTRSCVSVLQNGTGNEVVFKVVLSCILDREIRNIIQLRFELTDSQHNLVRISMFMYIEDINDNAPVFSQSKYTWTIPERPCNNTFNGIMATDVDIGRNAMLTYSMRSQDSRLDGYFEIDSVSGIIRQLKCIGVMNIESRYNFIVKATDGAQYLKLSSQVELSLTILHNPDVIG